MIDLLRDVYMQREPYLARTLLHRRHGARFEPWIGWTHHRLANGPAIGFELGAPFAAGSFCERSSQL